MAEICLKLHKAQSQFVRLPQHYAAFVAGIGSGKSYAGCVWAFLASMGQIGDMRVTTPNLGIITAPTYPMLKDATLETFLEIAGDAVVGYHKSDNVATMINGSRILFRSADNPKRLRGPNALWWLGDEAALYAGVVWRIMMGRLRQHGYQGWARITTTPAGRNWIYQEFLEKHIGNSDYVLIHARTADNPFLADGYVQSLYDSYVGEFARQELEGEFVGYEGLVYPEFSYDRHVVQRVPQKFAQVIAGVDWGFTNPGVIQVLGISSDRDAFLIHEEYARNRGIDDWANIAVQLRDMFKVEGFYCDPSEPDYIRKFNEFGARAYPANNTISTGIQNVKRRLTSNKLKLYPGAVYTRKEMESYEWMKNGDNMLDKPKKANDHTMDALRYAIMEVDGGRKPITVSVRHGVG